MNRIILYIALLLLPVGCGGSKQSKQNRELEKLALAVMEVHDRSMPDHGKLFGLKKKLLAIEKTVTDSITKTEITNAIIAIEKADNDMMDWMHTYKTPEDFLPFEEKKAYYIDQKKRIEDVETFMNHTMDISNQLIQKYSANPS